MSDGRDLVAEHIERQRDELRRLLAEPHPDARWWFRVPRHRGEVWDQLAGPLHVTCAGILDPRPERRVVIRRAG